MPEATAPTPEYTMGYSPEFLQLLDRRNAQANAGHLLPHLASGFRLLDFGCGPGSITVGLAQAVHPGEVHGIDMEESQIELGRAGPQRRPAATTTSPFTWATLYELPFEDNYFDAAHCHAVLMHVPETQRALQEVKRVLKPGGIIAGREMIERASFSEPTSLNMREAWETFGRLLTANGGHPAMGTELKSHLLEAGFTDVHASGSFDFFGSTADVAFLHAFICDWFFTPRVVGAATQFRAGDARAV